jgi:pyruvate dehydrogenase E1 component
MVRGFVMGATAGRTTLNGEGLQHEDGHSHILSSMIPNCRSWDPTFAYEVAVIIQDGLRRMVEDQEDVFYYITVMNENYAQPSAPWLPAPAAPDAGKAAPARPPATPVDVREGILRGMHCVRHSAKGAARARLLGSGTILREALAAAELLETEFGIGADVYSVTSYTELRREAMVLERQRRLGMGRGSAWIEQQLSATGTPIVAASDYVSALPDLVRPWVKDRYIALGTDGFGRSDTRAALRRYFEVDRRSIAVAALSAIDPALARRAAALYEIGDAAPPWCR